MQNQTFTYTFPLFNEAYNCFIGSFKNKQLLLGGPQNNGKSVLNLFSYEDQNLRKSSGQKRQIQGRLTQMAVGEYNQARLALVVNKLEGKHHLQSVKTENISKQEEEIISNLYSSEESIEAVALRTDNSAIFLAKDKEIALFDIQKNSIGGTFKHNAEQIDHMTLDPNFEMLTYVSKRKQVIICDKKTHSEKYKIEGAGCADIIGIDYNPNKQYCLMTCHHEAIKFWDVRKGVIPFKTYDDHHNLLTQAKYNHSHDELITCGYDDGTVGLLRLVSGSSSMQGDAEDALVRLYDEHQDAVLRAQWTNCSPWIFISVSSHPSLLVLNIVPSAEKYRILL